MHKQQRLDQALEAYSSAIDTRSALVAAAPREREFQRTLANTYMNVGLVERETNAAAARPSMEKAQAIRESLLAEGPADPKVERDYAMGHYNLAILALRRTSSTTPSSRFRRPSRCSTPWRGVIRPI